MMSGGGGGSAMELDFFGMEKGSVGGGGNSSSSSSSQSQFQKLLQQSNNTNGVQTAISKINPQLLKTVIDGKSTENFPPLPVYNPIIRNGCENSAPGLVSNPLTIFYNGKVCVFDMPHDKAEMIMKIAEEGALPRKDVTPTPAAVVVESVEPKLSALSAPASTTSMERQALLEKLNGGDLPIARKKSLQRFLEKRKERGNCRLATVSEGLENKKMKE